MTEGIRVNRVLDKSFGYGIVLSGAAANVKKRFDDYISNNINQIMGVIEKDTRKLFVREIVVFLIRLLKLTPLEYPNRCVRVQNKIHLENVDMLFTDWEVRIEKTFAQGLECRDQGRSKL